MKRIMIFGKPGSGKSTLALKISQSTGIPVYHLDRYFFTNNWAERDYQEFLQDQKNIVDKEEWIIDGNSTKSLDIRYRRAELVIYLNYPRSTCFFRLMKRWFGKTNKALEQAGWSKQIRWSLLTYTWTFEDRVLKRIVGLKAQFPHIRFIEVNNNIDLKELETKVLRSNNL